MNMQTGWTAPDPVFNTAQQPVAQELAYLGPYTRDNALLAHAAAVTALANAKQLEMDLRKLCVRIAIPKPVEGMNTVQLGNGYQLKAGIKFNYNLSDANAVEKALDKFAAISNEGPFIADRLVTWTPTLSLTEYRKLCEDAETSQPAALMLSELRKVLTVTDAAPTLEIKEPKAKR